MLVIVGLFFLCAYSVSPLKNSHTFAWGMGGEVGLGEWGIHLVAGLPTGAEGPCSLHRSPECPYFSPCLSFLSSGLGSQSGASVQVLWRLALRWPAPRQRRMPRRMGKKPHKGAGCTQLEGRRSQQVHTQAACLVPSFPSVMPGATPLSLRGSAGRAVTPDVCPLCQHFRYASSPPPRQMYSCDGFSPSRNQLRSVFL